MQFYNPDDYASDSLDADPRADQDIAHWIVDEDGVGRRILHVGPVVARLPMSSY